MTVTYSRADEVESIAKSLIGEHHTHLIGVHVEYCFRSEAAKENGKEKWGSARKVTGLNAYLFREASGEDLDEEEVEPFVVIEIAQDIWANLAAGQRRALVDHELCHLGVNDKGDLVLNPHDLEEFRVVVDRHGLWRPDVRAFAGAVQAQLPGVEP